jgi:hypothetical protein
MTVEHLHKCSTFHSATMPVHEVFRGQTVRKGDVEAFTLSGHPNAQRADGWSDGAGDKERFFAVLEIPAVKSATDSVRASIVADAEGKK